MEDENANDKEIEEDEHEEEETDEDVEIEAEEDVSEDKDDEDNHNEDKDDEDKDDEDNDDEDNEEEDNEDEDNEEEDNEEEDKDEDEEIKFTPTGYAYDERTKDGYIFVIVAIFGLKTSKSIVFKGILPKIHRSASNATVEVVFEEKSCIMELRGKSGDLKWKNYRLHIRELPYEIVPDKSYHEIEKDRVLLYLCKKEDICWDPKIMFGLDMIIDGDDE